MSRKTADLIPEGGVIGRLPFEGWWLSEVSPARRVPSHGTDLFGTTYALDFLVVDDDGRTAPARSLRTVFAAEPPELFYAFGRPLYSPVAGTVVSVHDGEPDHEARRSILTLIPYGLSQPRRIRRGLTVILGNHVIIQVAESPYYVGLVHLQRGSVQASAGDRVSTPAIRSADAATPGTPRSHISTFRRWTALIPMPRKVCRSVSTSSSNTVRGKVPRGRCVSRPALSRARSSLDFDVTP